MRATATAVLLIALVVPSSVFADPAPTAELTGDCALARKANRTCVLELPAEDVGGERPVAGDVSVRILTFGTAASLIRLRRSFIPEIVKAAEDL